jgi:2,4-dienoyl-CoA reductase-like NADH-dependent reductase (Old Yellow Enzyme family)
MMLFEKYNLAGIEMKNRLVRSATYEKRADLDGFVTEDLISMYGELAKGGVGLIITGNALVHVSGPSAPLMMCIHNDHYIEKLKRLTDAVHKQDGKIVIQLSHGGRQSHSSLLGGESPIAPSEVSDPSSRMTPRAMTGEEIWMLVEAFGEAVGRAAMSGFDGVQIHGAHGYLVNQFLSPHTNRRNDYWGGDEERRFHFIEEVFKEVRKEVGKQYPVMIKMNADDCLDSGLRPPEALRIAKRLVQMGMDAVEVSGGMHESAPSSVRPKILESGQEAYFRDNSRLFKEHLDVPVILVGGIRSRSVAEDVLQKGDADLVSIARPLIREPDLPRKFMQGKERADCISCNGCLRFKKIDMVKCVQLEKA